MQLPRVRPDGFAVTVILSILATAGFCCVLIMAPIVSGLIDGLHISAAAAGRVQSCNVYGMSLGAFAAVLIVRRAPWRPLAYTLLGLLIALDLGTTQFHGVAALMLIRFAQGMCGGLLIGVSYGVFARSGIPDRCFGMMCAIQGGLGGVGIMFLPRLVPVYGTAVLFETLAAFSAVTLLLLPLLPEFALPAKRLATAPSATAPPAAGPAPGRAPGMLRPALVGALLSILFFQAGNAAIAAYIIELGRVSGLELRFITDATGIAGWIGMAGALLVAAAGARWGRTLPIAVGTLAAVLGNAAFHASSLPIVFAAANVATAITWFFTVSYLLGLSASFDRTGRSAALGGLFSKLGYATGPYAASLLVGAGTAATYGMIVNLGVALVLISAALAIGASRAAERLRAA